MFQFELTNFTNVRSFSEKKKKTSSSVSFVGTAVQSGLSFADEHD